MTMHQHRIPFAMHPQFTWNNRRAFPCSSAMARVSTYDQNLEMQTEYLLTSPWSAVEIMGAENASRIALQPPEPQFIPGCSICRASVKTEIRR